MRRWGVKVGVKVGKGQGEECDVERSPSGKFQVKWEVEGEKSH
jgi:hypothetical protein